MKCLTADEIVKRAKEKIVPLSSQERAIWDIATIISLHLKRLEAIEKGEDVEYLPMVSQLIIASTGSGKTYLISQLAKVAGLEFHTIDCSMLTLSGYKGVNVGQAFHSIKDSSTSKESFSRSIILFDEFDKCSYGYANSLRSGNPQPNFLAMLEGKGVMCEEEKIDTSKMLFLFSGAFQDLENIIEDRVKPPKRIGFADQNDTLDLPKNIMSLTTMDDIQAYGFNRELLGRIGSIHYIPPLTRTDFRQLITSGRTSLKEKYDALFANSGVSFTITDKACDIICDLAEQRNMGARAANPIIFEALLSAYRTVDNDKEISEVVLAGKENRLAVEYRRGERFAVTGKEQVQPHDNKYQDISLVHLINDEATLNSTCIDMLKSCGKKIYPNKEALYYFFLQTAMRFLALETNQEDQLLSSIAKLAECIKGDGEETSTFDILITDVTTGTWLDVEHKTLSHFYIRYKNLENSYTYVAIRDMVREVQSCWPRFRNAK